MSNTVDCACLIPRKHKGQLWNTRATWEEALAVVCESEVKAKINGVAAVIKTSEFLFGLMLAEIILKLTAWQPQQDHSGIINFYCGNMLLFTNVYCSLWEDQDWPLLWSVLGPCGANLRVIECLWANTAKTMQEITALWRRYRRALPPWWAN